MSDSWIACPHCGAELRANAKFCRHCGSSESDGWSDEGDWESGDDFDYDQFVDDEFGSSVTNTQTSPVWRIVAVVLLILFGLSLLLW